MTSTNEWMHPLAGSGCRRIAFGAVDEITCAGRFLDSLRRIEPMTATRAEGRILVVDDEEHVRRSFANHLEENGYEVETACSTKRALEMIAEQEFDLVLFDMHLPPTTGTETVALLREKYSPAELPIIINSTSPSTTDIVEALMAGANDYVTKDVDIGILLARIRTNVALKKTNEQFIETNRSLLQMQKKLEHDLEAAAKIQQEQMPDRKLVIDGWEVAWGYQPCDTLGGDSLNVIRLDDEHWAFYVLDVSGHGVPASLLAVSLNRILSPGPGGAGMFDTLLPPRPLGDGRGEQESASVASAVYVLERLQEKFVPQENAMQFFTILYVTLNSRTGEMRIASGGHPGPILTERGRSPLLLTDPSGPPIGLIPLDADIPFIEADLQLMPGDQLMLYSDGLIEAFNDDQELFGVDRLQQCLADTRDLPLPDVVQRVHDQVHRWRNGASQKDDETLLCIRRNR